MKINGKAWLSAVGLCLCNTAFSKSISDDQRLITTGLITSLPTIIISGGISKGIKELKNLVAIKDDAAVYVATEGVVRGPFLESALQILREDESLSNYSDIQLTHALLAG